MKIGVYLASDPFFGGTYQYNLSIIDALDNLEKKGYSICAFYYTESWESIVPNSFEKFRLSKPSLLFKICSKLYRYVDTSVEGARRFDKVFNSSANVINRSECDIIIYPSQDKMSYLTKGKSLTAIHDLMHRYESHFEEYQGSEISARDKHYKMICEYSNGILVDSKIGREHVVESYGVDRSKIFKLPFVPPSYLIESKGDEIFKKFNLPERFVFYPAQFWEHKNHLRLIEAIEILKRRGVRVNLVLVGSQKNSFQSVLDHIGIYGLEDRVKILGYVSNDEILTLYREAVAMVFVSLIGPTNIPPVEALVTGCPLICSNAYAMPEQIGDAAIFFDPLDSNQIANSIELVWKDEILREQLRNKGFEKIKEYGQNDFNILIEQIIDEITQQKIH